MNRDFRLFLWDLDYTLIFSGHVDREVWMAVCSELSGRESTSIGDVPGRTDPMILLDTLLLVGVEEEEARRLVPRALQMEVEALRSRVTELSQRGRRMPGALEVLTYLDGRSDIIQAPVTGNVKPNARLKLETFGLAQYFNFDVGGYGSDSSDRSKLVALALERASLFLQTEFSVTNSFLAGDSVLDVRAALEGGACPIGVATGRTSAESLREAGASYVFEDLHTMRAALETLLR